MLNRKFPATRMRRSRFHQASRRLVAETILSVDDLVLPLFICEGKKVKHEIPSMPAVYRRSIDELLKKLEDICKLNIPAIALFPQIDTTLKDKSAKEALNPNSLVSKAIQQIKKEFPQLLIICDVALDPYTNHGHDGIINDNGEIINDLTVSVLKEQALIYASAGADVLAPSDMMDGRVSKIRQVLEANELYDKIILSYAAKYSSSFYAPFREAIDTTKLLGKSNKSTYQMAPTNSDEALHEVALDINEGADWVMVKPATLYLDIIQKIKTKFNVPVMGYHVSGEYAMLKAATQRGWINEKKAVVETFISCKRAGCDAVFSYFAEDIANLLKQGDYGC